MSEVNLPEGWCQTKLAEIAEWGSGGTPSRKEASYYEGDIPWVKTGDLGPRVLHNSNEFISEIAVKNSSAKYFPKGSVAIAMYGATIGKTSILGIDATTNQACGVGNPIEGLTFSEFLYYFLLNEKMNFIAKGKGGAQPNISQTLIKEHGIALPSLAEQKVIADKLDHLLAQVETTKARLDRIPQILKTFRQSVLAAAMSGKLTEAWREKNIYSAEEQYDALTRNEEEYLALKLKDDKSKIFKEKVKFRIQKTDNSNIELPQNWIQKPFFELCLLNRGFDLPNAKRVAGDYPILSAGGEIGTHNEFKVDGPCLTVGRSGSVGQVFYTESNAWPLNTALYAKDMGFSYPRFVYYKLLTMNLAKFASSTSVPTLNRNEFTHEMVEIPPLEEQIQIVRCVEELFAFADRIEQKANAALERVNNLTQSILAKAFRGELTADWRAQNPDLISGDNSAEALLEKIKAEREALSSKKKPKKKAVKKAK